MQDVVLGCSNRAYQGKAMNTSRSLEKMGVPSPVTGSQPLTALKPSVPQPGLSPVVIYGLLGLSFGFEEKDEGENGDLHP